MTTANANQFIGSKISLISKSEIRYEGILYSLDLQEATISLAKVKSFGTEDRPTERPVPHKEEIYEFIIFRGADIKGIDVLEPPKATATLTSGLPNDPAIVEVSHYHSSGQSSQPPTSAVGAQGASYPSALVGSYPQGFGAASSTLLGGVKPVQQGNSELNTSGVEQPSGISVPLESTGSTHDTSRSNASTPSLYSNRKSPTNDAGVQVSNEGKDRNNRQFSNRQGEGRGSRNSSQDRRRQPRQQQVNDRQGGYQPRGRGNFVNNRGGFRGGRGSNRGGYRSQGIIQAQNPPKVTFEDAYDFEKANEELSKLKIKPEDVEKKEGEQEGGDINNTEEEQENKEPPEPFYVKDSFYDKISCESTERGKGRTARIDWRAERKLNAETFGLPANSGQRRGYQRGGGYRGGFRGGYQGSPRGGFQQRGGYGGYNTGYGYGNNGGWQYNNRYNGGRGNRGGYRQQQQNQPQSQQQPAQ